MAEVAAAGHRDAELLEDELGHGLEQVLGCPEQLAGSSLARRSLANCSSSASRPDLGHA